MLPEIIDPLDPADFTLAALTDAVSGNLLENNRLNSDATALRRSEHWNDMFDPKALDAEAAADDPYVSSYLHTRAERVHEKSQALAEQYPQIAARFEAGVRQGIAEGFIPEHVESRLDATLQQTAIQVADHAILNPDPEANLTEVGFWDADSDLAQVSHDRDTGKILVHELLHKLSGGRFENIDGTPKRTRLGFKEADKRESHTGLTEAIDHHLTLSFLDGDFATLDPDKRTDNDTLYYCYRKILAEAVEKSSGILTPRAVIRASFEDSDDVAHHSDERRAMIVEGKQAYGPGLWNKLEVLFRASDSFDDSDKEQLAALVSRIHGPQLGEDSKVKVAGYIDLDGLEDEAASQE